MKLKLLVWSLCLACSAAQAQVVDLGEVNLQQQVSGTASWESYAPLTPRDDFVGLRVEMSHLPEPAVFLMMLTGLILLGGIARHERSDVFTKEE